MIQEFLKYSGCGDDDGSFSRIAIGTADKNDMNQAAFDLLFTMMELNKINITGDSVLRPYLTKQYIRGQYFLRTVYDMMDKLSDKIAEESSCLPICLPMGD
jgi:hypothetical protein